MIPIVTSENYALVQLTIQSQDEEAKRQKGAIQELRSEVAYFRAESQGNLARVHALTEENISLKNEIARLQQALQNGTYFSQNRGYQGVRPVQAYAYGAYGGASRAGGPISSPTTQSPSPTFEQSGQGYMNRLSRRGTPTSNTPSPRTASSPQLVEEDGFLSWQAERMGSPVTRN